MKKSTWMFVAWSLVAGAPMFSFSSQALAEQAQPAAREIEIVVEGGSYKPARITMQEGERVRLKFVRKEHNACTKEVVFPTLNIRRELPPNKPVLIDLPELKAGEVAFQCGMNMVKGVIVVQPKA